jgi:nitrite reductase/ring-hydroxylating ferredoxin subunit
MAGCDVAVIPVGALEVLTRLLEERRSGREVLVVGYVEAPDAAAWRRAERLGVDRVVNVGALTRSLREVLADPTRAAGRLVVARVEEVAGRLGVVARLTIDDVPYMVVRTEGAWVCLEARCPHQGGDLSQVPCEDGVLTCPVHGSQFRCETGDRVRGPADRELRTLPVAVEGGELVVRGARGSVGEHS